MKSTFGLDKNYEQVNFEEVSVEELQIISGGSGGGWVAAGFATATALGLGSAAFGSGWGTVGVALAFSPAGSVIVAGAMVGLALYAGYQAGSAAFG